MPGEVIILYATGLGATRPGLPAGQIPTGIAWLDKLADFRVTLTGETVDRPNLLVRRRCSGLRGSVPDQSAPAGQHGPQPRVAHRV